jgi:hypothetical protein
MMMARLGTFPAGKPGPVMAAAGAFAVVVIAHA